MIRLRELRESKGWTQQQLGDIIGAGKSTISEYERDRHQLDIPTIHRLCDLFGCSADYLLCRSESPDPGISDEDARFLAAYDAAPDNVKEAIDVLLLPYAEKKKDAS